MELLDLRLALETLLADDLGEYTLPNGITTPALAVRSEGESLPTNTKVSGLEVVVLAQPALTPVLQYEAQGTLRDWTVYLIDWDGTVAMDAVASKLLYAFAGSTTSPLAAPRQIGPKHQRALSIPGASAIFDYTPPSPPVALELPKSISIANPQVGDDFTLLRADTEITLTAVIAVLQGTSSPSVTFVIKYASDRTASGTAATISTAVTSTTTGTNVPLDQMPIPSGNFVWLEISAVSGTVTELSLTLET